MTLERAAETFREGAADTLVDGHTFDVLRGEAATKKMDGMVRDALAYNAAAVRILNEHAEGITVVELATAIDKAPEIADTSSGANSLPLYSVIANAEQAPGTRRTASEETRRPSCVSPLDVMFPG